MSHTAIYKSDNEITATVRDSDGNLVSGATVTLDVEGPDGSSVLSDENMPEDSTGMYKYNVDPGTMDQRDMQYKIIVTVEYQGNQYYVEAGVHNEVDNDHN